MLRRWEWWFHSRKMARPKNRLDLTGNHPPSLRCRWHPRLRFRSAAPWLTNRVRQFLLQVTAPAMARRATSLRSKPGRVPCGRKRQGRSKRPIQRSGGMRCDGSCRAVWSFVLQRMPDKKIAGGWPEAATAASRQA